MDIGGLLGGVDAVFLGLRFFSFGRLPPILKCYGYRRERSEKMSDALKTALDKVGRDAALARDPAIEALAAHLFWEMERLDPTGQEWLDLSDLEREFYYCAVRRMMKRRDLVDAALASLAAEK